MELLLNYLLKSGLCLLALYLFYYAALRKQPNFGFNRFYLLLATPVALAIPLLKWPASFTTETVVTQSLRAVQLPEITISAQSQAIAASDPLLTIVSFNHILLGIYIIGACILIINLIRQLTGIRNLAAIATPALLQKEGVTVLETPEHTPTFAFLSYVFISRQSHLSETEQKQVLEHEMAHVQLKHTVDILYLEVLTALLWFNPVVWLLKNELRDVHEYQADARVLTKHKVTQYSSLLSKEVLYKSGIPVGSYFKEPQVFKRLQMLNKYGKRPDLIRPVLIAPLLGGLAFVFSSHQLNATIKSAVSPTFTTTDLKSTPSEKTEEVAPQVVTEDRTTVAESAPKFTEPVASSGQQNEQAEAGTAENEPAPQSEEVVAEVIEEKPFTYVEQMPRFEEGELALQKFLAKHIRYPEAAIKDDIEGIVFITFTISKEGKLTDYEIVKGLSKEIDAEALRILMLTKDRWAPGRQNGRAVPVRFTIPIRFSLNK